MRGMIGPDAALRRELLRVIWTAAPVSASFLVFAWLTKEVAALRTSLPFTEDPYDAVVSFAVIAIGVIWAATVFRVVAHARRPFDPAVARRVAIAAVLALAIAFVGFVSDAIAVFVVGVDLNAPGVRVILALLGVGVVASIVAGWVAWTERDALLHPPVGSTPEPDMLDDLGALVGSIGAGRVASVLASWGERSPVSPRRHRFIVGAIVGAAGGLAGIAWHAISEGPWASPAAAALFGVLVAIGVAGTYLVSLVPLRILRTPPGGNETPSPGPGDQPFAVEHR
jgi:hypothetical protein